MSGAASTRGDIDSVYTQCSKCETVFKLSADVLRAAGGQVRCGKCGEVFNALAHLAEDASAFTTGETELDLETRANSILESPPSAVPARPRPPPSSDEDAPPGIEIARLQILDWNESETRDDGEPDSPESEAAAEASADAIGETSMEFTLPPGELDRIFVENKKRGLKPPTPIVIKPAAPEVEEFEVFSALREPESDPEVESEAHQPAASVATSAAVEPQADIAAQLAPAESPSGFEVSDAVRREMLSGIESEDVRSAPRKSRRTARLRTSPFDLAPPPNNRTFIAWLIAAVASAALLIAQMIHQNRDWLAAHGPLGGALSSIYARMGSPVSTPANLSAYQLRQWGVTGDPDAEGTLRVRASILNTAAQLEPYPLLRVTLANRFGGSIGTRDFEPAEYLGKPTAKLLVPGERVDATLDILDPGKSAEGFEIDVCLRSAARQVSCANDKTPPLQKR